MLAHEVFHSFRNKKGNEGWLAIKFDMEKAYDRLEWNFILATFRKLGFCEQWITWIKQCITTVSFSVLVNGIPGEMFSPSKGVRQGDPLSPYIFILCAKILAQRLFQASSHDLRLVGVTFGHSRINIPFLTFANDTMIFAKAKVESCLAIKSILNKYCSMSGQLINFHKSAFQCTDNTPPALLNEFQHILQMDNSLSLGEYLGCPIIISKVTNATFSSIQEKVAASLPNGKLTLYLKQVGKF